jgi:hypothetical protein
MKAERIRLPLQERGVRLFRIEPQARGKASTDDQDGFAGDGRRETGSGRVRVPITSRGCPASRFPFPASRLEGVRSFPARTARAGTQQ